ncbi:hypothetical protein PWG14_26335 [Chromobacterium amazonense]|nr:hypothetical protein [Chromobacterium amazonense]MDE1715987.1 hypothetical protein [Chromobacterium amazonense]
MNVNKTAPNGDETRANQGFQANKPSRRLSVAPMLDRIDWFLTY